MASIAAFQAYLFVRFGQYGGLLFVLLLGAAIVEVFQLRPHIQRSRLEPWGTVQLFFTSRGGSMRQGRWRSRVVPWARFRRLRFRRLRYHKVHKDLWRLRLSVPFWQFLLRPLDALIECTRREAALVRGEIRRRMRAAGKL